MIASTLVTPLLRTNFVSGNEKYYTHIEGVSANLKGP